MHGFVANLTINAARNHSQAIPNDDCDDIVNFGLYRVLYSTENSDDAHTGNLVLNVPWDINTMAQLFFDVVHSKISFRVKQRAPEFNWEDWVKIALATPPQEFDLPLAEGVTALQPCTYWKNQFSEVTLGGCTSGSVSDGATIATLPEGFRPDHPIERPATFTASGNRYAGSVFIDANGIVSIHTPAEATNVVFAASFLAKN